MTDIPNIQPTGNDPKTSRTGSEKPEKTSPEGPAFHVLLERLQARASELERTSVDVNDPEQLAGAVDTARASLEDALSLSDQILEAYREARQQTDPADAPPDDTKEKQ